MILVITAVVSLAVGFGLGMVYMVALAMASDSADEEPHDEQG